jgi:RimJ/RimL family protein N-acetyltransferase
MKNHVSYDPITLREVRESDLELLREHRNDPGTRGWLENSNEISAAQQAKWYQRGGSRGVRIAVLAGSDVGLSRISMDAAAGVALVGLDIFQQYRGKGLAKSVFYETCNAALAAGAGSLALWVFWDNKPAVRVYRAQSFAIAESEPVKWFVRRFPQGLYPAPHAYIKMIRGC